MKQVLIIIAVFLSALSLVSILAAAFEPNLVIAPDALIAKHSLCNTFGGCRRAGKRSLCNTFGGCGRLKKRSMCNTFGGCGPARGARSYNYEREDESGPISTEIDQQNPVGNSQQSMLDYSTDYIDRATMALKGFNQPYIQDSFYDSKPKQFLEYTY